MWVLKPGSNISPIDKGNLATSGDGISPETVIERVQLTSRSPNKLTRNNLEKRSITHHLIGYRL
jgi:hypothetical protein